MGQKIKYKIAFLTHGDRNIGGGERFLACLVSKLDRDQFEPVVLYSKRNEIVKELEFSGVSCEEFYLDSKLTTIYRDQFRFFNANNLVRVFSMLKVAWRLYAYFKKNNIDIVFAHDNLFKLLGVPAAKLANKKIVTVCHDQLGETAIDKFLLSYQRRFMDRVFCVSKNVAASFARKGRPALNTLVVYNGLELSKWQRIHSNFYRTKTMIGIVAVFDQIKGHDVLFRALKTLINNGERDFLCIVVGDGREKKAIHASAIAHGLENYIDFRGYQKDVPKIMQELDILIIPSLQESFGMVAIEAMAMEVPVIASAVGIMSPSPDG